MKMKNFLKVFAMLIILLLSGCESSSDKVLVHDESNEITDNTNSNEINNDTINNEINAYMSQFRGDYMSPDDLELNKRSLADVSTEGGEITQYKTDTIIRYNLIYYGEMGKSDINYYFINDFIYYSCLDEYYSSPIYIRESDILYRTLENGVIRGEEYYIHDQINDLFIKTDTFDMPYSSLEELNDLFEKSE